MGTRRTFRSTPLEAKHVYDQPATVERYSERSLWTVEQHLCNLYLRTPGRLLDIACAAGRMAIPLSHYSGLQVFGMDIAYNQVKEALAAAGRSDANCHFCQGDMRSLSLAGCSMDYVFITYTSLGALTTVKDRELCVREVMRVLKPSGLAFISVWNRFWPGQMGASWAKWTVLNIMRLVGMNPHGTGNRVCWESGGYVLWHYFSLAEAKSLFTEAGLRVMDLVPFEGAWTTNRLRGKDWWSRHLSEGFYFILRKESPGGIEIR